MKYCACQCVQHVCFKGHKAGFIFTTFFIDRKVGCDRNVSSVAERLQDQCGKGFLWMLWVDAVVWSVMVTSNQIQLAG